MADKNAAWLDKILDAPNLSLKEIQLLMNLDATEPVYTNVREESVSDCTNVLEGLGYSVGLFTDTERSELNVAYVLQVRKDAI